LVERFLGVVILYVVIPRGCDFFDFSQKVTLKTMSLDAKKSSYRNKVTASERSEESLFDEDRREIPRRSAPRNDMLIRIAYLEVEV
jgi:hypothetical protein